MSTKLATEYKYVALLCVDYRYHTEFNRVKNLLKGKGFSEEQILPFIDGHGQELPLNMYSQLSPQPPHIWQDGPAAYSHYVAMQTIIKKMADKTDSFLFVEDDLIFTDNFDEILNKAQVPADWDMIYYGANHTNAKTRDVAPYVIRVNGSACTHCVAFRHTIYNAVISLPADRTIDWNIANRLHDKFNCYAIWPSISIQKPGYSLLWKQKVDYTNLWKNKGVPS